jgi:hypothetical protein
MAKKHSIEAFYAMDDPLEAAVFSELVVLINIITDFYSWPRWAKDGG